MLNLIRDREKPRILSTSVDRFSGRRWDPGVFFYGGFTDEKIKNRYN